MVCALLAALIALVAAGVQLVRAATAAISAIPMELQASRTAITGELHDGRKDLLARGERQLVAIRKGVLAEAGEVRQDADRRVGDTLSRVDVALGTVDALRRDIAPVLQSANQVLRDTDRTIADLHPQMLGLVAASKVTAGETAQTMRDVRGAVPGFLAQGQAIADNAQTATLQFSGLAANLNRLTKPKWYDRLLGYGLNGVILYRNLNPATNLTVKGAQFLIAHP